MGAAGDEDRGIIILSFVNGSKVASDINASITVPSAA